MLKMQNSEIHSHKAPNYSIMICLDAPFGSMRMVCSWSHTLRDIIAFEVDTLQVTNSSSSELQPKSEEEAIEPLIITSLSSATYWKLHRGRLGYWMPLVATGVEVDAECLPFCSVKDYSFSNSKLPKTISPLLNLQTLDHALASCWRKSYHNGWTESHPILSLFI